MQRKKFPKVSLSQIALAAGVSKTTVSYVMRNSPGPAKKIREHVRRVAQKLGYVPDPRISSWMARVRDTKERDLLPLVWLDTNGTIENWEQQKFLSPYIEGARARALQLGYRLEIISARPPGGTMQQAARSIYQRGIEGVIVTHYYSHIHLRWESLAAVALELGLMVPHLHQVKTNFFYNLLLALKMVKRYGYRRIGICLEIRVDRTSLHSVKAAVMYFQSIIPKEERIPPLFYRRPVVKDGVPPNPRENRKMEVQIVPWMRRYRPDVIVGHCNLLEIWAHNAGLRVPEDIGIVHLATDDDVSDWAGIYSNRREIGAVAVEQVVSLMQNRLFGLPKVAIEMEIRGRWQNGRTLLVPKSKEANASCPENPI